MADPAAMDFGTVSANSLQWPYEQIAAVIRDAISAGELRPGARISSIRRIAQEAEVAKGSVQNALAVLRDEGLVETRPGRGSFVADPLPPQDPPPQA